MAEIYRTEDGREFDSRWQAESHANDLAKNAQEKAEDAKFREYLNLGVECYNKNDWDSAINCFDYAIKYTSLPINHTIGCTQLAYCYSNKNEFEKAIGYIQKGFSRISEGSAFTIPLYSHLALIYIRMKDLDNANKASAIAIEKLDKNLPYLMPSDYSWYSIGYIVRGMFLKKNGNTEEAIEYWKKAADLGAPDALQRLAGEGVEYVPKKYISPKSSSSSSYNYGSYSDEKPGFIVSAVIAFACAYMVSRMFSNAIAGIGAVIFAIAGIMGFIAYRYKNIKLRVILAGLIIFSLVAGRVKPDFLPRNWNAIAVNTVTVTSDALNLRAEASSTAEIVKTLQNGAVLTVTGEAQNGWLPVTHEKDSGWVSAELVK